MKNKAPNSKRLCPGDNYGISISICKGRQKTHYPKCHQCGYKAVGVGNSSELSKVQTIEAQTPANQTKPGLTKETRKTPPTGTKQLSTGLKEKDKGKGKSTKAIKQKKTGSIMVKSEPSSARICLDGENIGVTPAIIRQVLPGTYEIEVKMNEYETWNQKVNIESNKETLLNAVLKGKNGSLFIESSPTNARIFIDNEHIGVTPADISQLVPDTYDLKIKMSGYTTWKRRVDVKANKTKSISAVLQGKDGSITIESEPTKGMIYLDGNFKSTTPETLQNLKPGEYTVSIKHDEYKTWENSVKVDPEKETFVKAVLINEQGSLSLESEPPNAKIFINGKAFGITPITSNAILHGVHLLEVTKDGYEAWRRKLRIEPGQEKSLSATLQLQTGSVCIESNPAKAMIYLDDNYIGTTPDTLMSITPGTHEIKLKLDGYDVWSELLNVEAGKEKALTASLQITTGSVMIESNPAKATIYFDGNKMGETPDIIISSSIGTHLVEVRKEGYNTWTESVEIESGKEKELTALLQVKTGTISINSQPTPAMININGNDVGATPGTITKLIPGTYKIVVKKPGYEDWNENVEVVAENEKLLTAVLQKTKGSIRIISKPVSARIYINGEEVGITPNTLSSIDIGSHDVEIKLDGYAAWKKTVNVKKGKLAKLNVTLQMNTGSISIKSDPAEAKIFLNGKERGITPSSITSIEAGMCEIEIKLNGYAPLKKSMKIKPGREASLIATLQMVTGTANINSEPPTATIYIDGKNIGTTPKTITNLIPGKRLVEVGKDGYESWSENVNIIPDKEIILSTTLQLQPGSVIIESEPSHATAFLDEKDIGATPVTITDLSPGTHKVDVKSDGYDGWSKSIEILPGKKVDLTAKLQPKTGSVNIKSEPSNAMVLINEKDIGTTPIIIADIKPGKYKVKIREEGYDDWNENIDILPEKEVTISAGLKIKPGSVSIVSKPSSAMAFLDDKDIGTTPVTITDLSPGTHKVDVRTDGYEGWSKSVEIAPGMKIDITAELQVKTGSVCIKSQPPGAMILLDKKEIGTTPVVIDNLIPGRRMVVIRLEGYEDWSEGVDIISEEEAALTAKLQMQPGSVSMTSKPSGAIVSLDKNEVGTTPVKITDLQPGVCNIDVKMVGYKDWSETIDIINGKEISLTALLQIQPGSVSVQSEPSDAIVLLDNTESGKTPITISKLNPGNHSLIIKMEGYENCVDSININPNEETSFKTKLTKFTGDIYIKSKPPKAKIYLDGKEAGSSPDTLKAIEIGPHEIEIRADGYITWKKSISINKGKNKKINALLQVETGSLSINSEPPNANVIINGKVVGNTPVTMSNLRSGTYNLEVTIDGYEDWKESVDIIHNQETTITAELNIKTGTICVNSKPTGAKVLIEGNEVGNTPVTKPDLKPGVQNVEIQMEGYETWNEKVEVVPDKESVITAELKMETGSLSINSEPTNANVSIDGKVVGKTPATISDLNPGTYNVEVKIDDHIDWKESVEILSNNETTISAELNIKTGTICVNSKPTGAKVLIEGNEVGNTPVTIPDLKPGVQNVEIQMEGYETWNEKVEVVPDKESVITAELKMETGSLSINSEHTNANVSIDGKIVGKTPVTISDLNPGTYNVEVKIDDHIDWKESVEILSNKETTISAELNIKTGTVFVDSKPPNARIIIEGREFGVTPFTTTDLMPGTFTVEVLMEGYEAWKESVDIISDKKVSLMAELQMKLGSVNIISEPSGSLVILDGQEAGTSPMIIDDLKPGTHNLRVMKDGYEKWFKKFNINPDKAINIAAELRKATGSIAIKSNPKNATIYVDSIELDTTPANIKSVTVGTHEVEISLDGYNPWKESINIKKGKNKDINATLQIINGSLCITSEPSNAQAMLEGKNIGNTPIILSDLKQDTYKIEIIMDGYHTWKESVDIVPGEETSLSAMLKSRSGTVSVKSVPTDALVLINDKEVGKTPVTITDLKPETYNLEVRKSGYLVWSEKIVITSDDKVSLAAMLQVKTGSVTIKSEPHGATTLIDGKDVGTTPKTITDLIPGKHNVEIVKNGYANWNKSVIISLDKEITLAAKLKLKTGAVSIKSKPSSAKILIDNKQIGTTPVTITDLKPGIHNIKASMTGYETWHEKVDIRSDTENSFTAILSKITGSITIKSNTLNAKISLDGNEIGTTPLKLSSIAIGPHEIEVSAEEYIPWMGTINIKKGLNKNINAVLEKCTGSFDIESVPTNAKVLIDGKEIGITPLTETYLKPATYNVDVIKLGYKDWKEKVEVISNKKISLKAELHIKAGLIKLKSDPTGGTILMDGKIAGTTPVTLTDLNPGMHHVEVRMDGYEDWRESVEVTPDKEINLTAVLQSKSGSLKITSNPSAAMVFVDSKKIGVTPNTVRDLDPGMHTVEIKNDGYECWSENVDIIHDKNIYLTAMLQLKLGSIIVNSKPPHANVLLDGREVGTTPVTINELTPETHYLEIRMDGYNDWRDSINIIPGKETPLTASLQIKEGSISIMSIPSNAKVLIDGKDAGTTPITKSGLKPGTYNVEVLNPDYKIWKEDVIIVPGKEIELTAVLQSEVGSISIKSEPPDAVAFINGKEVGTTPITLTDFKLGTHNIDLRMDGYYDWKEGVNITTDDEITVSAILKVKVGSVSVKSKPTDAKTFIDGEEVGVTPITINGLEPGAHMLDVRKEGLEIWREKVVIETDKEISVVALLQKTTGIISIKSTPSKAKIYIDGVEVGTTPATLNSIAIGSHEIEVKIEECEIWKKTIILKEGREKKLNATLQLNVGSISIESYPEKAKIILDGKEVGKAPNRFTDIIVGMHDIEVLMNGYITWKRSIKIKAGKEISLTANLKKAINTTSIKTDSTTKVPETEKLKPREIRESELRAESREENTVAQSHATETSTDINNIDFTPKELVKLRSTYMKISDAQISSLPKISIRETNNSIFLCHSTIRHCYQMMPMGEGEVVIDHATELMWYKSGSSEYFNLRKAKKWIKMSNKKNYANFNDWRLPTLEEASSLLEFEKKNDNFIDPVFDKRQWGTWTGDKCRRGRAWIVTFVNGTVGQSPVGSAATFVRPVRLLGPGKK